MQPTGELSSQSDNGVSSPALRTYIELERLVDSRFAAGERLPAERVLAEQLGTSRGTVRQALFTLQSQGRVEARPNSGWYARARRTFVEANEFRSFTEFARECGFRPGARVLTARIRSANVTEAAVFGLAPSAPVYEIERVRLLDDLPVCVHHLLIPKTLAPTIELDDLESASLNERMIEAGCMPDRADYTMEAQGADERHAGLLGIQPGEPVLAADEIVYDPKDRVVQAGRLIYRGDSYRFQASLHHRHQ